MENSKLITLLRSLDNREWRSLHQLVEAPYFNRNPDVIRLCQWLDTYRPELTGITRQAALAAVFPNEPADDARLNHTMSFLLKLAETWIALEQYQNDPYAQAQWLLRGLATRGLDKHYTFHLAKTRRAMSEEPQPGSTQLYQRFALEIFEAERFVQRSPRQFNESVQTATDHLDAFYLLEKLRRTCYMYASQAVVATPYQLQLVEEICRFVDQHLNNLVSPAIEAYYRIFQLLSKPQADADFEALKQLLAHRSDNISREDLADIYQYAINFCNIQIMHGREAYEEEAFNLYLHTLETGILLISDKLSPWHFKNIVNLALRLHRFHWTETFIAEKNHLLAPEFQSDALHFNLALVYYTTGRLDEALEHLQMVEFTDVHYSISAKAMLCQIYYQQDQYNALDSALHAFDIYLRRNKLLAETTRTGYLNFTSALKKLLRTPSANWPQLRADLEQIRILPARDWFVRILE
ncbi:MAG TPA: hypothetical protein VK168_11440 [Saprospiraceae bacterium]|nr:hypothetical protein [Saprospiraceae bacterium]